MIRGLTLLYELGSQEFTDAVHDEGERLNNPRTEWIIGQSSIRSNTIGGLECVIVYYSEFLCKSCILGNVDVAAGRVVVGSDRRHEHAAIVEALPTANFRDVSSRGKHKVKCRALIPIRRSITAQLELIHIVLVDLTNIRPRHPVWIASRGSMVSGECRCRQNQQGNQCGNVLLNIEEFSYLEWEFALLWSQAAFLWLLVSIVIGSMKAEQRAVSPFDDTGPWPAGT